MPNNNSVEGMVYPTMKGPLAGTPRDSAMANMKQNNELQAQASTALSGGRHRKRKAYRGGEANSTLVAPQANLLYPEVSGPGTGVNSQMQGNAQISTQMAANSALDKVGGSKRRGRSKRRSRKGGNPDWLWGCMSGGKKKTSKAGRKRKSRKSKKNRKSRKH
jgi:hypothetical protein